MPLKTVAFDLDGTLTDSVGGIEQAMALTCTELGLPAEAQAQWRDMIGLPLQVQFERILPHDVARGVAVYRRFHAELGLGKAKAFPRMGEILQSLAPHVRLAIASSKSSVAIAEVLRHLGWDFLFDPVISPLEVTRPKPHPESLQRILSAHGTMPSEALYIGDSEFDMRMAVAAGVEGWGVAWGVHAAERLREAGAVRVFSTPQELGEALALN